METKDRENKTSNSGKNVIFNMNSFCKYVLTCYMPVTVLGTGDKSVSGQTKIPAIM